MNIVLYCDTETVLQEFVPLAQKCREDGRLNPILVVPHTLVKSQWVKNGTGVETILLNEFGAPGKPSKNKTPKRGNPLLALYKKLPQGLRGGAALSAKHDMLESNALKILKEKNISALLLSDDRVVGDIMAWLAAAGKLGVLTAVVPFAISHPEGGSYMRRNRIRNHVDKGWDKMFKRALAKRHPNHVYASKYGRMLFYAPHVTRALAKKNLLPDYPWVSGGGASDKAFVISSQDRELMRSLGIVSKNIEIVGQCSVDALWEANTNRDALTGRLRQQYGLPADKPILIFALPHLAEHKICSWEEHEEKLRPLLHLMAGQDKVAVLLSPHPRGKKPFYRKLAEEYRLALAEEPLRDILPAASIFMATHSSTVRWAGLLRIPAIILDYGIGHTFLGNLEGNVILSEGDIAAIRDHIARLIDDSLFYKRAQNGLGEATKDELFDGKVRLRIIESILAACASGKKAAVS